jgi:hypothetical protein
VAVGYSGTPLPKKLGISATTSMVVLNEPEEYKALLGPLPPGLVNQSAVTKTTTLVHVFVKEREALA